MRHYRIQGCSHGYGYHDNLKKAIEIADGHNESCWSNIEIVDQWTNKVVYHSGAAEAQARHRAWQAKAYGEDAVKRVERDCEILQRAFN